MRTPSAEREWQCSIIGIVVFVVIAFVATFIQDSLMSLHKTASLCTAIVDGRSSLEMDSLPAIVAFAAIIVVATLMPMLSDSCQASR